MSQSNTKSPSGMNNSSSIESFMEVILLLNFLPALYNHGKTQATECLFTPKYCHRSQRVIPTPLFTHVLKYGYFTLDFTLPDCNFLCGGGGGGVGGCMILNMSQLKVFITYCTDISNVLNHDNVHILFLYLKVEI